MSAHKIKAIKNVQVVVDPPRWAGKGIRFKYGTQEYWKAVEKELTDWVKEFHEFIRDHRSQDPVYLDVVLERADMCSACGCDWELYEEDGKIFCAGCGEEIESSICTK